MRRKVFVAINIGEKDKKKLFRAAEKWHDLPVRWTKERNLHVTLLFLGFLDDDLIGQICARVREAARNTGAFDLEFDKITAAPSASEAKMIWLSGKASDELRALREKLEKEMGTFITGKKSFRPHITLGRIRRHRWDALPEKPNIHLDFPLNVWVGSVEVMSSEVSDGSLEYAVLESCPLK